MGKYIVVFVSCGSMSEAKKIAKLLVNDKVTACVNIIGGILSLYWWEGKVNKAKEVLLIAKTLQSNFANVQKIVTRTHSYEIPEIIAMPISKGNKTYLKWIDMSLKRASHT